jgi:hypothetical protein
MCIGSRSSWSTALKDIPSRHYYIQRPEQYAAFVSRSTICALRLPPRLGGVHGAVLVLDLSFIVDNESLTSSNGGQDRYFRGKQRMSDLMRWRCH